MCRYQLQTQKENNCRRETFGTIFSNNSPDVKLIISGTLLAK